MEILQQTPSVARIDLDIVLFRVLAAVNEMPYNAQLRAAESSLDAVKTAIKKVTPETEDYLLYLTGSGNFRYKVATFYKAHRKKQERPRYLNEVKDYFVEHHAAIREDGYEADDLMAMDWNIEDTIVSLDKDFRQLPNTKLYNWVKDAVTYGEGWRYFCEQLLIGDKADNIPGTPNPNKKDMAKPPNITEVTAPEFLDGKKEKEYSNRLPVGRRGQAQSELQAGLSC